MDSKKKEKTEKPKPLPLQEINVNKKSAAPALPHQSTGAIKKVRSKTVPMRTNAKKSKKKSSIPLYDNNGVHIATSIDLCDCLNEACPGCFFGCPKCGSPKCGLECRVRRTFTYDAIEYQNIGVVVENPLLKKK